MDFYINLKVNFRGNAKSFLLSGSETKSWESMEAMVSRGGWWADVSLIAHLDAAKPLTPTSSDAIRVDICRDIRYSVCLLLRLALNHLERMGQATILPKAHELQQPYLYVIKYIISDVRRSYIN